MNIETAFLENVSELLIQARKNVKTAVNLSMVYAYYEVGRRIVLEEQKGKGRAEYGTFLMKELSGYLTKQLGKGFSVTNLKQMRQFYLIYVNYYDRKVKLSEENPTIGIILCKDKHRSVVEMTLPENNNQIFASRYQTVLPSKEELQKLLNEQ